MAKLITKTIAIIFSISPFYLNAHPNRDGCPEINAPEYVVYHDESTILKFALGKLKSAEHYLNDTNAADATQNSVNLALDRSLNELHVANCYLEDLQEHMSDPAIFTDLSQIHQTIYDRTFASREQARLEWEKFNEEQERNTLEGHIRAFGRELERIWDGIDKFFESESEEQQVIRISKPGFGTYTIDKSAHPGPWIISFEERRTVYVHECGTYAPNLSFQVGPGTGRTIALDDGEYMRGVLPNGNFTLLTDASRC